MGKVGMRAFLGFYDRPQPFFDLAIAIPMAFSFLRSGRLNKKSQRKQSRKCDPALVTWTPMVGRLEPRLVLNASAELNPLGQLVLIGTEFSDSLRVEFDSNSAIQILDDTDPANPGRVVPIAGHPDGVGGEVNPLAASEITSGQVFVSLGLGDDSIFTPLLGNLDVSVIGDSGNDTTTLQLDDSSQPATGTLFVQSEQITLSSSGNDLSFGQADVQLDGNVRFDSALTFPRLHVDNQLVIDGTATLSTDTTITGSGRVDFSDAILSADVTGVDLRISMPDGLVLLGEINSDAGESISTLTVQSVSEVIFAGNQVSLDNELTVVNVADIHIESEVFASDVFLSGDNVTAINDVTSEGGDIEVEAAESFILHGEAEFFSGDGRILIRGDAASFDASAGLLRSNFAGDAIIISGFDQVNLGNVFAADGQFVIGVSGNELNNVVQEPGTLVTVDRLAGVVMGEVRLFNNANQIGVITDLIAGDDIDVFDSVDDLLVEMLVSSSGSIDVMTVGALSVGNIQATGSANIGEAGNGQSINLNAERIDDASDDLNADLVAANVTLTAVTGIGAQRELELDGTIQLTANTDIGDVGLLFLGDQSVVIRQVTTTDSNVLLETTGVGSDLVVDQISVGGQGLVTIISSDDIVGTDVDHLVSATQLSLVAANGVGDQTASIDLRTEVNDLAASVQGDLRGDLRIENLDLVSPLRLGALPNFVGQSVTPVQTDNGQIIIRSGAEIEVVDLTTGDAGLDQQADPEIIARGSFGRVDLEAATIDLQADVQIHGERLFQDVAQAMEPRQLGDLTPPGGNRDDRTIFLATNEFLVGKNVELFTGEDQGTARRFLPRPDSGVFSTDSASGAEHAFFDPASVRTNVLTQALQNDATGILTVNVGTTGERGLTVTIDWGDSDPRRFQQVDNLDANQNAFVGIDSATDGQPVATQFSAGDGTVRFTHLYLENDTLNSRSNGRTAATEPYNVRFSVRHHDSIVVQGLVEGQTANIFQAGTSVTADGELVAVPGGLFSSTDNPATNLESSEGPALETGTATFIIPNLSIPVAFFPVRDVIPEFEPVNQVVTAEQSTELVTQSLETTEVPTTSIVNREEYFQLRILSPDPNGEDLAPPEKLPPEIFDGDQLRSLFSRLPDGAYEIEKVVGDGNERSILRVEVRQGEATIPDDDLDEGVLQLTPLDLPANPDEPLEGDTVPKEPAPDLAYLPGAAIMAVTGAAVVRRKQRSVAVTRPVGDSDCSAWRQNKYRTQNRSRLSRSSRFGKRHDG
jgi:hypothetical protein